MTISYRSPTTHPPGAAVADQTADVAPTSPYAETMPRREVIPNHPQHSVRAMTHDFPSEICGWNAHPEYEIHLITKTHGSFIAGDHIGTFGPGHVSIIGPNLPHDWVSDLEPGDVAIDRDVVIQFTDEWIRQCMRLMPELQEVDEVLKLSTRGIVFSGATAWRAAEEIMSVVTCRGPERVGHLFRLLGLFAESPEGERTTVASEWMGRPDDDSARSAGEAGLNYIFSNLTGDIRLTTAAKLAYMSEPTFSKYFKRATGLTFSNMVKKLRVAHARRLLDTTDHPITKVATLSGYHNMANFNRQFLSEVGTTPSGYRRLESSQKPPNELISLGLKAIRAAERASTAEEPVQRRVDPVRGQ